MPSSWREGKPEVKAYLVANFPPETRVLDVGPGSGAYHKLLRYHFTDMDCVEVHEPYVDEFELRKRYKRVFIQPVQAFTDFSPYGVVIMGDVLEHLTVEHAQKVLASIPASTEVVIGVPFEYEQGAVNGVEHEEHLQPDLTMELFMERYPGFRTLHVIDGYPWGKHKVYGAYFVRDRGE